MANHHHLQIADSISTDPGAILTIKRKLEYLGRFSVIYEDIEILLRDHAPETLTTVITLKTLVKYDNQVIFRQSSLAKEMGVTILTVQRHIKKLRELTLLIPDPREENTLRPRVWRLHPKLVWRGTGQEMRNYLAALPPNHPFTNP